MFYVTWFLITNLTSVFLFSFLNVRNPCQASYKVYEGDGSLLQGRRS